VIARFVGDDDIANFSVDARPPAEPVLIITSGLQCSISRVAPMAAATLPMPDFSRATSTPAAGRCRFRCRR
jgi:hypothetical protein